MPVAEQATDALFASTHDALRFAFNFSHQQYDAPAMTKLMGSAIGTGKGLVGLDGAAQAGFIMAALWRLPALERNALVARYGQQPEECRCCGADRMPDQWMLATEALAAWAVPAGISHLRARRALVRMHFTRTGTVKQIAADCGADRRKVGEQSTAMARRLKDLEAKAQASIDDALRDGGMVG